MTSLPSMLERTVRLNPKAMAMSHQGRTASWQELYARVARLGAALASYGLAEGERVAILSLNSDRYYETVFAIPWAGLCVVPLNTRWALPENNYALSDSETKVLFFDDAFAEQACTLLEDLESLQHAVYMGDHECPSWAQSYEQLISDNAPSIASGRGDEEMAGIFYTGGTTGFPKGVMQSHRAIWASALGTLPEFQMRRDASYLHVAPMFHMADFAGSMGTTLAAGRHVVLKTFDPEEVLATFAEEEITHVLLVPAMIKMLLNHPLAAGADVSTLRYVIYGASPMPAATLEQFMATWPSVGLIQAYGQTELAPVATMLSSDDHRDGGAKLSSAGRPTAINDIRILDEDGKDCPTGVSGEVVVRGPHTMIGYWNKPEETQNALRDGWVYTGDAAYFDEEGYLFIVDRVKDMVVTGGENVFTTEVENAVISHDAVQDVAVIGVPHAEWGESVHAIVIPHEGKVVNEEELIAHCRERIAGYKLPKSISFRKEPLPLSGAGKVLKTELRKPFWEGHERQVN
ncbi:MAG: long-chain fatty acid--CoA ligase [Pseudomonadota bacterium]